MKSKMISVWAVLLLGTSPIWAQKYHDAIVEDACGPVKMIKSDGEIFTYDSDGRLTAVDHEDVPDAKYDSNGYPVERCSNVCTQYEYNADGQLIAIDDDNFLGHGVKYKRDAQGRITTLYLYLDKACSQFNCSIDFTYNDKGQIATKSEEIADENTIVRYSYNDMGYMTREALYVDGQLIRELSYEYDRFDYMNNWTSRWRYNSNLNYKDQETRTLTYWESSAPATPSQNSASASAGWQTLIGKRLSLTTYGISQNGQEVNRFQCQTGEYIKLGSDGILYWENRYDGSTSYRYRIDGKRIYLTQISGKETGDKWLELTRQSNGLIKTESNLGT